MDSPISGITGTRNVIFRRVIAQEFLARAGSRIIAQDLFTTNYIQSLSFLDDLFDLFPVAKFDLELCFSQAWP